MAEYKLNAQNGIPYSMEINGRLWGSFQLAIDAGVDFPALLVESALGANTTAVTTYASGVRSRWEWGDVDHLLACVFHSASSLSLPTDRLRHRRSRVLSQFLRNFTSADRPEALRFDDPAPFIRETKDWIRGK
jgi:predicted ATP-grasp superfamily ATP-dependent carboligase